MFYLILEFASALAFETHKMKSHMLVFNKILEELIFFMDQIPQFKN